MTKRFESFESGERAAKIGLIAVGSLGAVKGLVGVASGSVSLVAQAVDSLTDLLSLVAIFAAMRLSKRDPSDRFPYGYYKVETMVSLGVASLIIMTGLIIILDSVIRVLQPEPISAPLYAVTVAATSIPILILLSRYVKGVGDFINSQALQGQAADFRVDIYMSVLVLVGVTSSLIGYPWIEGIVAVVISLLVLRMGAILGWDSVQVLMDAAIKPERIDLVKKVVEGVEGVREIGKIRMRRSGPLYFGELTIEVDKDVPVERAHLLSQELENRVKQALPELESLMIYVEPPKKSKERVALPLREDRGMNSPVTSHFASAPYFMLVDVEEGTVQGWIVKTNPSLEMEKRRGVTAANFLVEEKTTILIVGELGDAPFHILRDCFVEIYILPELEIASEALESYRQGKLDRMREASHE